jgi:hypothetical protein
MRDFLVEKFTSNFLGFGHGFCTHIFSICRNESTLQGIPILVYSTLTDSSLLNPLISFDMDSLFWICNNSAMGHVCNDRTLFLGELVPSIYEVGSATGTLTLTLTGLVDLCLTDDKGVKHSFALTNVNYLLELPVNILSLWQLAELYPDKNNHPDRTNTGIPSVFDNHILFWDREKFKKTF